MLLSLVVAAVIVAIAIAFTTSRLPLERLPPEQTEELRDEAEDRRDDRRDAAEDRGDDRQDANDNDDNSGPGS